ncbi:Uncharacterised protein [Rodentibacter pneumotropicus]|uniref:Uncharacterized protein n=1 Tax=Rodentibacter pneumotropicus TaxID=758 RepID=A0A448MTM1_9PAST|nr:Uncharacterised protein [Rodentibacter pneumotropicus]
MMDLQGQFLVAMPHLADYFIAQSSLFVSIMSKALWGL